MITVFSTDLPRTLGKPCQHALGGGGEGGVGGGPGGGGGAGRVKRDYIVPGGTGVLPDQTGDGSGPVANETVAIRCKDHTTTGSYLPSFVLACLCHVN